MAKEMMINFDVVSANITQKIELVDDCPLTVEQIVEKLGSEVLTSLGSDGHLLWFQPDGEGLVHLGKIVNTDVNDSEYEDFKLVTDDDQLMPATYVSVWDGGHKVETKCKVNVSTRDVVDIEVVDVGQDFDTLDEEYVVFPDGRKFKVENEKVIWC